MLLSLFFGIVGTWLSVQCVIRFFSSLRERNKQYKRIIATVQDVTPWIRRSPKFEKNVRMHRAKLEYSYLNKLFHGEQSYRWEDDCNKGSVVIYVDTANPNDFVAEDTYKSIMSIANLIGTVIFHLLFIIPSFLFAYYLYGTV